MTTDRRDFLKTGGMLIVALRLAPDVLARSGQGDDGSAATLIPQQAPGGPYPDPDYRQLDSWIVIREDNTATFYVGKTDCGQGTGTAFRQMMSDELDFPYDRTSCVMGSTDNTVDQGGSGGSDAIQVDGWPMRRVAAEARRVLLEMASQKFGVPVDRLAVRDGLISVRQTGTEVAGSGTEVGQTPTRPPSPITYGELIGGRRFNVTLTGRNVDATTGVAKVKAVQDLKMVGQSPQRYDIPPKVMGTAAWAVDAKAPGMLHARNVKPPVAGATLVSIDESSVTSIPGFVRVVSKGNYVAVVCEREEQAIRAAKQLKVNWQKPAAPPFPSSDKLFEYIRGVTPTSMGRPAIVGNVDTAMAGAVKVVEADYDVPFQGHSALAPAHAMADPSNGQMTVYSNDMKSYGMRNGIAQFLGMPRDRVRVIWQEGPQGYGRTAADDAGFEAAFLAKEIGRPVRVQWMRDEETAWDTKGPAFAIRMRGGLDAQGNLVALEYEARSADFNHVGYNEPETVLVAQLTGVRKQTPAPGSAALMSDMYAIPNRRMVGHVVSLPLVWETPVRTGNLRDPNGPQSTFAAESFIDELAAAAKVDPIAFRLKLLEGGGAAAATSPATGTTLTRAELEAASPRTAAADDGFRRERSIAVVKAAAKAFGWDARPSPKPRSTGRIASGRGFAYSFRGQTIVAEIAEVEVNRDTGRVWVKRLVCAHDCGLVINPEGLRHTIEGAMLHALSRALKEEVQFDGEKVTTVDWMTSPTLRHEDAPERIDVVLVNGDPNPNRPDLPMYGAGEASCKPMLAAVANAIFDATGVRLRRVPFRDARVLAALKAATSV